VQVQGFTCRRHDPRESPEAAAAASGVDEVGEEMLGPATQQDSFVDDGRLPTDDGYGDAAGEPGGGGGGAAAAAGGGAGGGGDDVHGGGRWALGLPEPLTAAQVGRWYDEVSHSCACIGSPCLSHCVHGASIGGEARRAGEASAPTPHPGAGGLESESPAPPPTAVGVRAWGVRAISPYLQPPRTYVPACMPSPTPCAGMRWVCPPVPPAAGRRALVHLELTRPRLTPHGARARR
jgi:hypothetical protein